MYHRPFEFSDVVRAVARRRLAIVLFFLATCLLMGIATAFTSKTYKSDAKLFMRLGRENTSLDATATLGEHPVVMMPQSRESEINSIVEIIQAKQLYENVVDEVGAERILDRNWSSNSGGATEDNTIIDSILSGALSTLTELGLLNDLPARERAVIRLQKKMTIEPFEKSNVIKLSFKSHSPELAQEVVERLIEQYQKQHVNLHRPAGAFEFLESETQRIESELSAAQIELELFKNRTGMLELDRQRSNLIDLMSQLQSSLLESQAAEAALKTEVEQLTDGLTRIAKTATIAETVGAGNEGVDGMRQEFYRLEVLRSQWVSKYTEQHPMLQEIDRQVQEAKAILAATEADRKESVKGPNVVHQETSVSIEQKRPLLAGQIAKTAALKEQIAKLQAIYEEFTANEREFEDLKRKVSVLSESYKKYFGNLEQARIDTQMKTQELSNLGIAEPATLNLKPTSPNKVLNLAIALILGTLGGLSYAIVMEYLRLARETQHASHSLSKDATLDVSLEDAAMRPSPIPCPERTQSTARIGNLQHQAAGGL